MNPLTVLQPKLCQAVDTFTVSWLVTCRDDAVATAKVKTPKGRIVEIHLCERHISEWVEGHPERLAPGFREVRR